MPYLEGASPAPERQEGRVRLSVRDPLVENLVGNLDFDGVNLEELRAWCKKVCRDRNHWSIQRGGGLVHRHLRRNDAEQALRRELAALAAGGAR